MKGGRWVVRTYKAGPVEEKSKVFIYAEKAIRRHRVKGNTKAKQADANARQQVKVFARTLNANFSEDESLLLTLSYGDGSLPEDMERCRKDAGNFLKRLKRELKKAGVEEVRTVTVCSDMDGETGKAERAHIHVVITAAGISFREGAWWAGERQIAEIWGGGVFARNVRKGSDLTPLAIYLLRQVRHTPDKKKYSPSRNLRKPVVIEEEVRTGKELQAPRGTVVVENAYNAGSGMNYIRYVRPIKPERKKRKRT